MNPIICILIFAFLSSPSIVNADDSPSIVVVTQPTSQQQNVPDIMQLDPPRAAKRIRNEPESVWVEFVELGLKNKPLNLGQGFPDFAAPTYLMESLRNITHEVGTQQYTRSFGHPRLINALAQYYHKLRNFTQLQNPNQQMLITVGAYEALFCSVMAFVEPGDQVLIVEPAFDAYKPMIELAQGRPVFIPLRRENQSSSSTGAIGIKSSSLSSGQFKLNMSEFEAALNKTPTAKTKMLILNTPNNPLGKVYTHAELVELANFCKLHNLIVIADEVYEQLYFESQSKHLSIAQLPDMWRRTITIGSAGKTFSVTGWKVGWAFGHAELLKYVQLIHQTVLYTVATPLQEAVARALERETSLVMASAENKNQQLYWSDLRADLLEKRDRMARILTHAGLTPIVPEGGYFMFADISPLAKLFPEYDSKEVRPPDRPDSMDYKLARWLSNERKLQIIPGSAFYASDETKLSLGSKYGRFCFIKSNSTLEKFEHLMEKLVQDSTKRNNE